MRFKDRDLFLGEWELRFVAGLNMTRVSIVRSSLRAIAL